MVGLWLLVALLSEASATAAPHCQQEQRLIHKLLMAARRTSHNEAQVEERAAREEAVHDTERRRLEVEGRKLHVDLGNEGDATKAKVADIARILAPRGPQGGASTRAGSGPRQQKRALGEVATAASQLRSGQAPSNFAKQLAKECSSLQRLMGGGNSSTLLEQEKARTAKAEKELVDLKWQLTQL